MAPRYEGSSSRTTSFSFINVLPIKSRPCCEPVVIKMFSIGMLRPWFR
jgi:hypothetical protein